MQHTQMQTIHLICLSKDPRKINMSINPCKCNFFVFIIRSHKLDETEYQKVICFINLFYSVSKSTDWKTHTCIHNNST